MPPTISGTPEQMPAAPRPRGSGGVWAALVLVVLVAAAGGAFYLFGGQYLDFARPQEDADTSRTIKSAGEEPLALSGKLLLTLRNTENEALGVYAYDLGLGIFSRLPQFGINVAINPRLSPDGSRVAFASHGEEGSMQIFIATGASDARQVTRGALAYKREPQWSPQGDMLTYVARGRDEEEEKEDHHVEGWSVYIVGADGAGEEYVGRGYAPLFSPDGTKLLYLQGDGLYLFDIESKTAQKVWEVEGGSAHSHMKLALSPDFSTLAWADHHARGEEGTVAIFRIDSWEEFSMKPIAQLFTAGVFMAFSPDSRHLAVQTNEVVWDENHSQASLVHPKVVVYPLSGGLMRPVLDLDGFDPSYLWLDYWVRAGIELK